MNDRMQPRERDLLDYGAVLWRNKAMIAVLFVLAVSGTLVVSLLLPKYYRSEAVILATASESGGLGAALSASPVAGVLGSSFGGLTSPADRVLVVLRSRTIAEMVIKRFDLLPVLFADKWDAQKGAWKEGVNPPFPEDAVKVLAKKVTTFKKSREGAITITVEWKDPKLAAEMANYYVVALAEFMKDKSVTTTVQTVDRAVPANRKSSPRIGLNMALAGILSLFIGSLLALLLDHLSDRRTEQAVDGP